VLPLAMQLLSRRVRPGTRVPALSADAAHLLLTYNWPGNVRELDNLLQRALILVNGPVIGPEHIQFELLNETAASALHASGMHASAINGSGMHASAVNASGMHASAAFPMGLPQFGSGANGMSAVAGNGITKTSLARTLGNAEKDLILEALRSGSPRREVAERLGISPRTLRHKLARLREAGVEVPAA
jgi:two-component system, response regulator FlrC